MHGTVVVLGFEEVREDLIAHGAGLEGAAGLDVLEFQEDSTSCGAGEGRGFDEGGWGPGGFVGWGVGWGEDAAHCECVGISISLRGVVIVFNWR